MVAYIRRILTRCVRSSSAVQRHQIRRAVLRVSELEDRLTPNSYTVNATTDTGSGSGTTGDLRYCITQANANTSSADTITFDPTVFATAQTITLTSSLPALSTTGGDLTITGPGSGLLTVQRTSGSFSLITSTSTAGNVNISGMKLTGGSTTGNGGAIDSTGSGAINWNFTDVNFSNNTASAEGGAVFLYVTNTATVTNCTFSRNTA